MDLETEFNFLATARYCGATCSLFLNAMLSCSNAMQISRVSFPKKQHSRDKRQMHECKCSLKRMSIIRNHLLKRHVAVYSQQQQP